MSLTKIPSQPSLSQYLCSVAPVTDADIAKLIQEIQSLREAIAAQKQASGMAAAAIEQDWAAIKGWAVIGLM